MSLFSNLFNKQEPLPDFSFLHTDIHSHLIPGIDDGVKTLPESMKLINELHKIGFKKIITTPHVMSDYYKNTPEIINSGLVNVKSGLNSHKINIEINAAAEYYADFDFLKKIAKEKLLTFGDKYILIEFSYFTPTPNYNDLIFELQTNGYKIILAHPERYTYWHNNLDIYYKLKDRDILFQLNLNSLTGEYSIPVKKFAEKIIKKNLIELVGTDLHNEHQLELIKTTLSNPYLIGLYRSGKLINNRF